MSRANAGPTEKVAGAEIRRFERATSTNDLAKAAVEAGEVRRATVWVAKAQTAARGRLGRAWSAPEGGLWFTGAWVAELATGLSVCIGGACALAIGATLEEHGLLDRSPKLKWPNDVMIDGKKVCGILCETARDPRDRRWLIVGVGVDVNNDPDELTWALNRPVTSLAREAGKEIDLESLMRRMVLAIGSTAKGGVTPTMLQAAASRLIGLDEQTRITLPDGRVVEGIIRGLSQDGRLVVEVDGKRQTLPVSAELP